MKNILNNKISEKYILAFIKLNYSPVRIGNIVKSIFLIIIITAILNIVCIFNNKNTVRSVIVSVFSIVAISAIILIFKRKKNEIKSDMLCKGIIYSYISILLSILSYSILIGEKRGNAFAIVGIIIFITALSLCGTLLLSKMIIKKLNNSSRKSFGMSTVCFISAGMGVLLIRFLGDRLTDTQINLIIFICLLLLSTVIGAIGGQYFLKFYLICNSHIKWDSN